MPYIHNTTFEVVSNVLNNDQLNNYFECDELLVPIIQLLNLKGYYTSNCCSGHAIDTSFVVDTGTVSKPPYEPNIWIVFQQGVSVSELDLSQFSNYKISLNGNAKWQIEIPLPIENLDYYSRLATMVTYHKLLYESIERLPNLNGGSYYC